MSASTKVLFTSPLTDGEITLDVGLCKFTYKQNNLFMNEKQAEFLKLFCLR